MPFYKHIRIQYLFLLQHKLREKKKVTEKGERRIGREKRDRGESRDTPFCNWALSFPDAIFFVRIFSRKAVPSPNRAPSVCVTT